MRGKHVAVFFVPKDICLKPDNLRTHEGGAELSFSKPQITDHVNGGAF